MKKVLVKGLTVGVLFSLFLSACQNDNEGNPDISSFDLESEAAIEATFEEVDLLSDAGMETLDEDPSGRITRDDLLDCAEVTKDTVNHIITIDFGDGCEGPNGVVKSGKVIIEYDGRMHESGSYRQISFEDFYVDSIHVEGVRKVSNVTDETNAQNSISFEIILDGGKLTFPDGTFATRDANHLRTLFFHLDRRENYATVDGSASGVNLNGDNYEVNILETLVFKRGCRDSRIVVPVAGVKEIIVGDRSAIIDYGDGECDNEASITADGETVVRTIRPRGRKW
ncbi:MAG: hypothetical protein ACFHWX_05930 [Bacteroidota bacterium]